MILATGAHPADSAALAARVLVEDAHIGETYTLTGPTAVDSEKQARLIAIGRPFRFAALSPTNARAFVVSSDGHGDPGAIIDAIAGANVAGPQLCQTVDRPLNRPPRSSGDWAVQHAGDFQ